MNAKDVFDEANCGIVGINKALEVYGGYDDYFPEAAANYERPETFEDDDPDYEMSKPDKLILADQMIARWQAYKDTVAAV